jgi:hypothetical protein
MLNMSHEIFSVTMIMLSTGSFFYKFDAFMALRFTGTGMLLAAKCM